MGLVIFLVGLIALWEGFYLLFVEVLNVYKPINEQIPNFAQNICTL